MIKHLTQLDVVNSYATLPVAFYTRLSPEPLTNPRLLHVNRRFAHQLGLSDDLLSAPEFLAVCAGAQALPGGDTLAAVYSGHQFGIWAGQLGDGRAHLLGEIATPSGSWEWQLKGSGRTPYSRMGDGRAVVRSSVREYLASEAMAGLGIPTTRALAIVVADDPVYRETVERAAIVSRLAPSFIRFGTFEHFSNAPEYLTALLEYVIDRFYPDCRAQLAGDAAEVPALALCLLRHVVRTTASLVADWMTVGFCHGVMNTDNMSVLGLSLDYGPYGFMDSFQADHICNHTDTQGRYAWNAQPSAAYWNLHRFAGSLTSLGLEHDQLRDELAQYEPHFLAAYRANMAAKLGLRQWEDGDEVLADGWWELLHTTRADFTLSFRSLAAAPQDPQEFAERFANPQAAQAWLDTYLARIQRDGDTLAQREAKMNAVNPIYVLRNYLAQEAIEAAEEGDASKIDTLLSLLHQPYDWRDGYEHYANAPPDWALGLRLSCSS